MIMKYPIGIQSFDRIIEDGYVYVDKTDLIYRLTHEGSIYFLSRPRRFGKSLLVSTLENYYLGRKELFRGLAMEQLEKEWNVHPVFHIDFNSSDFTKEYVLEERLRDYDYVQKWEREYAVQANERLDVGARFRDILEAAHKQSGRRAVVLVDEYDKPVLDVLDRDGKLEEQHRDTLKAFYSVFKGADSHLQFVLLTGVQGSGQPPAVRPADGSDQVLAGERVQRIQPTEGHQHGRTVRSAMWHHAGGTGRLFRGTDSRHGRRISVHPGRDAPKAEIAV